MSDPDMDGPATDDLEGSDRDVADERPHDPPETDDPGGPIDPSDPDAPEHPSPLPN